MSNRHPNKGLKGRKNHFVISGKAHEKLAQNLFEQMTAEFMEAQEGAETPEQPPANLADQAATKALVQLAAPHAPKGVKVFPKGPTAIQVVPVLPTAIAAACTFGTVLRKQVTVPVDVARYQPY